MRRVLAMLMLCSASCLYAADTPLVWSPYSRGLKLVSYNSAESRAEFSGLVTLRGRLFVEFDMETPTQASGGVNFARFVPDAKSLRLLPVVKAGQYAAPLKYVELEPAQVAFEAAVGAKRANLLSHGHNDTISMPIQITLRKYTVSIECDARAYWAQVEARDIHPAEAMATAARNAPHGC